MVNSSLKMSAQDEDAVKTGGFSSYIAQRTCEVGKSGHNITKQNPGTGKVTKLIIAK